MSGDLASELRAHAGATARATAVGLVDLNREPQALTAALNADDDSRFEIGSVSKAMTGMLLAEAVGRGEATLDSTLGSLLPTIGPALDHITVRELCTHTSGLPRMPRGAATVARALSSLVLGADPYRGITASDVLRTASQQRLSDPGAYRYSNLGASILGHLLARAADTDYPSLLRDRLLTPMRMRSTSVGSHDRPAADGWASKHRRSRPWLLDGYAPAGGVVSTRPDMVRFLTAVVTRSAPGLASLEPIVGVRSAMQGRSSGMFWVIDTVAGPDQDVIWHNGQTGGYSSYLAVFPHTGRGVVVLANVADAPAQRRIADRLLRWSDELDAHWM